MVQLEHEGEPDRFDAAGFERYLGQLHAAAPLVAVLFQEGWLDGESLHQLEDDARVALLRAAPARKPAAKRRTTRTSRRR